MQDKDNILLIYGTLVLFLFRVTNTLLATFLDQIVWLWLLLSIIIISYIFSIITVFYLGQKETNSSFKAVMCWSFMAVNFTEIILVSTIVFTTRLMGVI